jgi:hypothetical protein
MWVKVDTHDRDESYTFRWLSATHDDGYPCATTGERDTSTMTRVLRMEGGFPFVLNWGGTHVGVFLWFLLFISKYT